VGAAAPPPSVGVVFGADFAGGAEFAALASPPGSAEAGSAGAEGFCFAFAGGAVSVARFAMNV
jgi:hypothetical protein